MRCEANYREKEKRRSNVNSLYSCVAVAILLRAREDSAALALVPAGILSLLRTGLLVPHAGHLARFALPGREFPQSFQDGAWGSGSGAHIERPASGSQEENQLDQTHTGMTMKKTAEAAVSTVLTNDAVERYCALTRCAFLFRAGTDLFCIKYTTRSWRLRSDSKRSKRLRGSSRAPSIRRLSITSRIFRASSRISVPDTEATTKRGGGGESKRRMVNICGSHRKVNTIHV